MRKMVLLFLLWAIALAQQNLCSPVKTSPALQRSFVKTLCGTELDWVMENRYGRTILYDGYGHIQKITYPPDEMQKGNGQPLSPVSGRNFIVWVRRYNGPANGYDKPKALAVDIDGNVYVAGTSMNASGSERVYATIKYAPVGDTLWIRRYDDPNSSNDECQAMTLDLLGDVYVTGYVATATQGVDIVTIKYSTDGDSLWTAKYSGGLNDIPLAIYATDNYVYVSGYCERASTNEQVLIIKYDAVTGDELQVATYDPTSNMDYAAFVTGDAAGNIYVAGAQNLDGVQLNTAYLTVKYDANLNWVWAKTYDGSDNFWDRIRGLGLDNAGNIYVTGTTMELINGQELWCITTIKYQPNGNVAWTSVYPGQDSMDAVVDGYNLAVDPCSNYVYVTGREVVQPGGDYLTIIKYNSSTGAILWSRIPSGQGGYGGDGYNIVADDFQNIYVTGKVKSDYFTLKYDKSGNEIWRENYGTTRQDISQFVILDTSFEPENPDVIITGYSDGEPPDTLDDYLTIKYSQQPDIIPPQVTYITKVMRSGIGGLNVSLFWNKVTTDINGNPEDMYGYYVYRDTVPNFIPSYAYAYVNHPETTFSDGFAGNWPKNFYYLVKAVDVANNKSKPSNMGYKFRQFLNENPMK